MYFINKFDILLGSHFKRFELSHFSSTKTLTFMAPMMFLVPFVAFKKNLGNFNVPQCSSYHTFQQPLVQNNIKYKIFLTLMPTTFHMYILVPLVSFDMLYIAFNPQLVSVRYCSINNSCSTSCTWCF